MAQNKKDGPSQNKKTKKEKKFDPKEQLKFEIAEEIGLLDKVKKEGWGGLSSAESGKIGGLMTKRLKEAGLLTEYE